MNSNADPVLIEIEDALVEGAGFSADAVLRDYAFADYLGDSQKVRTVPLAAFSETPPSYRSARVAAVTSAADQPSERELTTVRGLGAPKLIAIGPTKASVWWLGTGGDPVLQDERLRHEMGTVIRTQAADWSPSAVLRSSGIITPGPRQMDLADFGLMPLIEHQVNEKLDRLIREVISGCTDQDPALSKRRGFSSLIRGVFWLLAAKVLVDRVHPGVDGPPETGDQALRLAQKHYDLAATDQTASPLPRIGSLGSGVIDWAWQQVQSGFHFQNLSSDALAFVYENTLVSSDVRQKLGIHGTPRAIAELAMELLPIEDLPAGHDVVLEPCCGFAPFLMAALRRLRQHKLGGLDPVDRHSELVRRLRGVELDTFAVEVGRLCLTLADYPNANGWQLSQNDIFEPGVLSRNLAGVGAVFSNPPFEAFEPADMERYGAVRREKPAELLRQILELAAPEQLGMVVPRVVLDSQRHSYRELRQTILRDFREVDTVNLSDKVFEHSDAETVLLIARRRRHGLNTTLRSAQVRSGEVDSLLKGHWTPNWRAGSVAISERQSASLQLDDLKEIWEYLSHLQKLGDIAEVHQGIQYLRPLKEAGTELVSEERRKGFVLGIRRAQDLRPYGFLRQSFLCANPNSIRRSGSFAWSEPKVVVNAARKSRGWWPLVAAADHHGLWCYQRLVGVWPGDIAEWPVDLIASVLNGPVANAFASTHANKRDIQCRIWKAIPMPFRSRLDIPRIQDLVRKATEHSDAETLLRLDAEVLRGYDLPPRLERRLLSRFDGEKRPGVEGFLGYYPEEFNSALPLYRILSDLGEQNTASRLLREVPVLHEPEVSAMFERSAAVFES